MRFEATPTGVYFNYRTPDQASGIYKMSNIIKHALADRDDRRLSEEPLNMTLGKRVAKVKAGKADAVDVTQMASLKSRLTAAITNTSVQDEVVFVPSEEIHILLDMSEMNVRDKPEYKDTPTYNVQFQKMLGDFLVSKAE